MKLKDAVNIILTDSFTNIILTEGYIKIEYTRSITQCSSLEYVLRTNELELVIDDFYTYVESGLDVQIISDNINHKR